MILMKTCDVCLTYCISVSVKIHTFLVETLNTCSQIMLNFGLSCGAFAMSMASFSMEVENMFECVRLDKNLFCLHSKHVPCAKREKQEV